MLTATQYKTVGGSQCPKCESTNIQGMGTTGTLDDNYYVLKVECLDCHATWNDIYLLAGYDDLTEAS